MPGLAVDDARPPSSSSGRPTRSPSAASLPTAHAPRTPGASSLASRPSTWLAQTLTGFPRDTFWPQSAAAFLILAVGDPDLIAPGDAQPSPLAFAPLATRSEARAMTLDPTLAPSAPAWRRSAAASGGAGSSATRPGWRPWSSGWSSPLPLPHGWCRSDGRRVRRWPSRSSASSPCSSMPCACDRRSPRRRSPSMANRVSATGSRPRSRSRCGRPS